ncbi:unnamed protein product [Didymodactylos carnosus]|uniref:Uncharacterized protein n=2 Tax=Didymodactylos carnosus TaxID=1234261 RepID=A0A815Q8M3_9BILA|nr:unnamed protein product [Didymodactylos carnosus]CAF4330327.1 unnamed protein product [Didymodactylos carnosus]
MMNVSERYRYNCSDKQYISYQQLGDGKIDCDNGNDELLRWQNFQCTSRTSNICQSFRTTILQNDNLVFYEEHCDTFVSDSSGADERGCDKWVCPLDRIQCVSTGQCIKDEWICDKEWDCFDGSDELNCSISEHLDQSVCNITHEHFCLTKEYLDDPSNNRPCLDYKKAGDGNSDCLGAIDERNIRFCNGTNLLIGDQFQCNNGSCMLANQVCDGQNDCSDGEDESFCHLNISNHACVTLVSSHYCEGGRCQKNCQFINNTIKAGCHITNKKCILMSKTYRTFEMSTSLSYLSCNKSQTDTETEIYKNSSTSSIEYSGYCNKGFYLLSNKVPLCFCPLTYYGERCELQSRRISLRVTLNRLHRQDLPDIVHVLVLLLCNDTQIVDHTYFVDSKEDLSKHNESLFYSRPFLKCEYSVQFEVYSIKKSLIILNGLFKYNITHSFLPSYRLAKILYYPDNGKNPLKCSLLCEHNGTCYSTMEDVRVDICICQKGWSGKTCEYKYDDKYCDSEHSLSRSSNICICHEGYLLPNCSVKNDVCESSPCMNNGTCYPTPTGYDFFSCICPKAFEGWRCENEKLSLTLEDMSSEHPFIIRSVRIHNTFTSIENQVLKLSGQKNYTFDFHRQYGDENKTNFVFLYTYDRTDINITKHLSFMHKFCDFTNINKTIIKYNNTRICLNIRGSNLSVLSLAKYCQNISEMCFYDKNHMCLCENRNRSECFRYNHDLIYCNVGNLCKNGGMCIQGDQSNNKDIACICPECTFGEQCQFSDRFLLSFETLITLISPKKISLYHLMIPIFFFTFGFFFNGLSLLTFKQSRTRTQGCGVYLLLNSCLCQISLTFLVIHIIYLIVSHLPIVINSVLNLMLCKSIDTIIISLSYSVLWLSAFVTGERALSVLKPIGLLSLKTPKCAMIITCIILFITFGSSVYTHAFMYKTVHPADKTLTWCVREISPYHQHFVNGLMMIHTTCPFILNFIFAMVIIVIISRTKRNFHNSSHRETLFTQIRQRQDLLLGPIFGLIVHTPQLVIQLLNGCNYLDNMLFIHIILATYYISFIPQTTIFFFYVLTSSSYKAALLQEATIGRWFNRKFRDEMMNRASSKQCENLRAIVLYHLTRENQDDPTVTAPCAASTEQADM